MRNNWTRTISPIYCERLHVRSEWRLPAVATCIFLWHVTLFHLSPARSSFFDHSSLSPLEANRARNIARIRKHMCIGGFLSPFPPRRSWISRFVLEESPTHRSLYK